MINSPLFSIIFLKEVAEAEERKVQAPVKDKTKPSNNNGINLKDFQSKESTNFIP